MNHLEQESMYFNGNKEIASVALFKEIRNSFTIEICAKPTEAINLDHESQSGISGISGQRFVIGPGRGENGNEAGVGISVGTNGIIVYEHSSFYLTALLVFPKVITNWKHIAIVYRDKTPYLYINGIFKKQGLTSTKESVYPSGFIGGYEPYGYYSGFVRSIKIWNCERTDKEIRENLNTKLSGNEIGLLGYWTFDGGHIKSHKNRDDRVTEEVNKKDLKMIFVKTGHGLPYPPLETSIINALQRTVKDLIVLTPSDDIIKIAQEKNPNVILYFSYGLNLSHEHLHSLRQLGVKTAVWLTDDPYYIDYTKNIVSYFDIIFTIELNCVHLYKAMGCSNVFYLPLAVDTEVFHPKSVDPKYQSDILFVGNAFTDRIRLFDSIAKYLSTKNTLIIGNWWERLRNHRLLRNKIHRIWVSPEETANYYNGAKIVINIHRSFDDQKFNYNNSKIPALSVNPRTFEIAACGAFQLTDIRHDLMNQYTPEYDIATYTTDKDLLLKLEHYLNHDDDRLSIANRGLQKTIGEQTYLNRINKLVDRLFFD